MPVNPDDVSKTEQTEAKPRFAYDDRPVHPAPAEDHPLEGLAGRGQTGGTPMGLGLGLSWAIIAVIGVVLLVSLGGYLLSLLR